MQKEELLDKKIEAIEQREENAVKKQKEIEASEAEINELKKYGITAMGENRVQDPA